MFRKVTFKTHTKIEIIDLTFDIKKIVSQAKVTEGICHIFVPHTTCAITLNENEPGLIDDLILKIKTFSPPKRTINVIDLMIMLLLI